MGREHRIISALAPTDVPGPAGPSASAPTTTVNGAPFYVMDFVDGHVVRDQRTAEAVLAEASGARAGESIVDVLAAHPRRRRRRRRPRRPRPHEGYIARQLKRWYRQFEGRTSSPAGRAAGGARGARPLQRARSPSSRARRHRPRRLPPRQLHGRRRRRRRRRARLGDLHPRRPARRRRPAARLLDRRHRRGRRPAPAVTHRSRRASPRKAELHRPLRGAARGRDLSQHRLLRRLRLLEAGLHHRGRLRPLRRRRHGRRGAGCRGLRAPRSTALAERPAVIADRAGAIRDRRAARTSSSTTPTSTEPVAGRRARRLDRRRRTARQRRAADASARARSSTTTVATFDTDQLLDHRARRPIDAPRRRASSRASTWPSIELRAGDRPRRQRRAAARRRRARPPVAGLRRATSSTWRCEFGARTRRRPRRLPGAGPPHPPDPPRRPRPTTPRAGRRRRATSRDASTSRPASQAAIETPGRRGRPPGASGCGPRSPTTSSAMPYPAAAAALIDGLDRAWPAIARSAPATCVDEAAKRPLPPRRARRRQPRAPRCVRQLEEQWDGEESGGDADGVATWPPADGHGVGRRDRGGVRALPPRAGRRLSARPTHLTTRSSPASRVRPMKVDGGISFDPNNAARSAKDAEAAGYDGIVDGRDQPRPVPARSCSPPSTPSASSSAPASPWPSPAAR